MTTPSASEPNVSVYDRLVHLGITLPPAPSPGGMYSPVTVFSGSLCYTSGHNCKIGGVLPHTGTVGGTVSLDEAREDARQCILNILSSAHETLGDLNRIKQVVKMTGFVASDNAFTQQAKVIDAASGLLIDIFGPVRGKGSRSAVGVNVLPNNQPVEIEILFELF